MSQILTTLRKLSPDKRKAFLASLTPEEAELLDSLLVPATGTPWREIARPEQIMPEGDWFIWRGS